MLHLQRRYFNRSEHSFDADILGASASLLCGIHCMATPFIFMAKSSVNKMTCESTPLWWSSLDYIFLLISFFAILHSFKESHSKILKHSLLIVWVILAVLMLNQFFEFVSVSEWFKNGAALIIVILHLTNRQICLPFSQCLPINDQHKKCNLIAP